MAQTQSLLRNPILQAAILAFALVILSCMLRVIAAQQCELLHSFIWAALQLARPAILAAKTSVTSHPCQASTVLQYVLQIVASNWPLPQAMLG
jgi:hypothetical protein